MNTGRYLLGDDLPKQNPWQHDRLGYAPFVRRIAKVIIGMNAPNGYVIGLHGRWGSGKSTAINFIIAHLEKHNSENEEDKITHIDFRPWIVSGHQDLIVAFFKILSENIGPQEGKFVRGVRTFAEKIDGTTDNLVDAAATVALSVDPTGGIASGFAGGLAKKSVSSLIGRFLENPSLQSAYYDLKSQLARSDMRFLVTIDDIDRLENEHVRSIMQMVKSIGQLPNVTYLLSYDRDIVWEALDEGRGHRGPRYAEKIVQQEIELPKPTKSALLSILDKEISFLMENAASSARWEYIVRDGIQRWVNSPRDVVRLSNAVKFSWPALENEIDPQDLLAMEGLRLFDTGAFNWVRDNRDFLFTEGRYILSRDEVRKDAVVYLKRRLNDETSAQTLRVMSVLFPQCEKWFEEASYSSGEAHEDVVKRRGIGSEAGYDSYFGLHPAKDSISKVQIDQLVSKLVDPDEIEKVIRSYLGQFTSRGQPMVIKLLDELRIRFRGSNPPTPTTGLLEALFRVGEDIISIDWNGAAFELSPRAQLSFLVRNILAVWGMEEATAHLIEAFSKARGVAFLSDIYVERGRELRVFESRSSEQPVITNKGFEEIGRILLSRIEEAASNGDLEKAPFYFDIMRAWGHLSKPSIVKDWLTAGITKSADVMARASRGIVSYSLGPGEKRYTMNDNPDPNFFDLQVLAQAERSHLADKTLKSDQRNLLSEIVRGSEQLLRGRSSENTRDD